MPEIADVAKHFDDISAYDAYTGVLVFKGQFNTFDETDISGSTERKRTLSVAPGTVLPTRKAINLFGEVWVIGSGNTDGIYDRPIRKAYWLKRSDDLATVRTPLQYLTGVAGTSIYASMSYLKDTVNGVTDSQYDPFWEVFVADTESIPRGSIISVAGKVLRVRTSHRELSGFLLAQADQLDETNTVTMTVPTSGRVYDPVTDTYSGGTATVTALVLDAYKLYKYAMKYDEKVNSGDFTAIVAAAVPVGSSVSFSNKSFRVASVQPEADAFSLHLVRL